LVVDRYATILKCNNVTENKNFVKAIKMYGLGGTVIYTSFNRSKCLGNVVWNNKLMHHSLLWDRLYPFVNGYSDGLFRLYIAERYQVR